ncbi:centromere protein L-like [Glandiceps talaboti]
MASARSPITVSQVTPQTTANVHYLGQQQVNRSTPWLGRRHTPYTKTPRSRRLTCKTTRRIPRTAAKSETAPSRIKELVGKTWRVYSMTPLHCFSYDKSYLKKYSRQLSAYLEAESHNGIAVDMQGDFGEKATFHLMHGVALTEDDAEAVEIIVKSKPQNGNREGRVVFTGVLSSVESDVGKTSKANFVFLPVLLVKGTVAVTRQVISWLKVQFDCQINVMHFPPMELAWMVSMWTGLTNYGDGSEMTIVRSPPLELMYTVPEEVKGLNTITMTIKAKDAKIIWHSVHDQESDDFTEEEMESFIQGLEAHFFAHFKINLAAMTLCRIGCPAAFIGIEGRVKILSDKHVHQVLRHFTKLVTEAKPSK